MCDQRPYEERTDTTIRKPVSIHYDDAPTEIYHQATNGLEATSRRLITRQHSEHLGVYHVTIAAPVNYSVTVAQDLVYYGIEGFGTVTVDGQEFPIGPGRAVFIPAGRESQHVSDEDSVILVVWGPAPPPGRHH